MAADMLVRSHTILRLSRCNGKLELGITHVWSVLTLAITIVLLERLI